MFRSTRHATGKGDSQHRSHRNRFQGELETILIISRNLAGCTFTPMKTNLEKVVRVFLCKNLEHCFIAVAYRSAIRRYTVTQTIFFQKHGRHGRWGEAFHRRGYVEALNLKCNNNEFDCSLKQTKLRGTRISWDISQSSKEALSDRFIPCIFWSSLPNTT